MSKLTILIFCVLGLISACVGQSPVIDPRPCPEIFASLEPPPGFNIASVSLFNILICIVSVVSYNKTAT